MASRKRKTIWFRTEEELADTVNDIVNDSDSDKDIIPEFSSSEDSESDSANERDNEGNISTLGPSRRQIDVTKLQGFLKIIVNQEYRACNLQLKMKQLWLVILTIIFLLNSLKQ